MGKPIPVRLDTGSAVRVLHAYVKNELAVVFTARLQQSGAVALGIEQDGRTELPQIMLREDGTWFVQTFIGIDGVES